MNWEQPNKNIETLKNPKNIEAPLSRRHRVTFSGYFKRKRRVIATLLYLYVSQANKLFGNNNCLVVCSNNNDE